MRLKRNLNQYVDNTHDVGGTSRERDGYGNDMYARLVIQNCKDCPFRRPVEMYGGISMCSELYKTKNKVVVIENENIIPDFCPFKLHEYQKGVNKFKKELTLLLNEFQGVSIMSVADWVSEIAICDGKECIKTGTDDLNSKSISHALWCANEEQM